MIDFFISGIWRLICFIIYVLVDLAILKSGAIIHCILLPSKDRPLLRQHSDSPKDLLVHYILGGLLWIGLFASIFYLQS